MCTLDTPVRAEDMERVMWNREKCREKTVTYNLLRKTNIGFRSNLLDHVTVTPIPRSSYYGGLPGELATSVVLDFPKQSKPTQGQMLSARSMGAELAALNETELSLNGISAELVIDVLGTTKQQ